MTPDDIEANSDLPIFFKGEVQFAGYSDSHTQGPKTSYRMVSSEDLDRFRALTVAKGNQSGQRMMMVLVLLSDEEKPEPAPAARKDHPTDGDTPKPRFKPGPYCMEAIDYCKSEDFRRWAAGECGFGSMTESMAAQFIYEVTGVGSRKELDTDEEARETFIREVRVPFARWRGSHASR